MWVPYHTRVALQQGDQYDMSSLRAKNTQLEKHVQGKAAKPRLCSEFPLFAMCNGDWACETSPRAMPPSLAHQFTATPVLHLPPRAHTFALPNKDMSKQLHMLKTVHNLKWGELEDMAQTVKVRTRLLPIDCRFVCVLCVCCLQQWVLRFTHAACLAFPLLCAHDYIMCVCLCVCMYQSFTHTMGGDDHSA